MSFSLLLGPPLASLLAWCGTFFPSCLLMCVFRCLRRLLALSSVGLSSCFVLRRYLPCLVSCSVSALVPLASRPLSCYCCLLGSSLVPSVVICCLSSLSCVPPPPCSLFSFLVLSCPTCSFPYQVLSLLCTGSAALNVACRSCLLRIVSLVASVVLFFRFCISCWPAVLASRFC